MTQSLVDSRYLVPHAGVPGTCVELIISSDHTAHEGHKTRNSECCEFTHQVFTRVWMVYGIALLQVPRPFLNTRGFLLRPSPSTRDPAETG